jgi:hypothetical protein
MMSGLDVSDPWAFASSPFVFEDEACLPASELQVGETAACPVLISPTTPCRSRRYARAVRDLATEFVAHNVASGQCDGEIAKIPAPNLEIVAAVRINAVFGMPSSAGSGIIFAIPVP